MFSDNANSFSFSVKINCWFHIGTSGIAPFNYYQCDTVGVNIQSYSTLTGATGLHMPRKTNLNVKRLNIDHQVVYYIPAGLENIFPNLIAIRIAFCQLKTISASNLSPFPNLVEINFPFNDIEILPADLFSVAGKKAQYVDFGGNKITKTGKDVLQGLSSPVFQSINFGGNTCVNLNVGPNDTVSLNNLQALMNANCV
jgi:hypothetical protein